MNSERLMVLQEPKGDLKGRSQILDPKGKSILDSLCLNTPQLFRSLKTKLTLQRRVSIRQTLTTQRVSGKNLVASRTLTPKTREGRKSRFKITNKIKRSPLAKVTTKVSAGTQIIKSMSNLLRANNLFKQLIKPLVRKGKASSITLKFLKS